MEAGKHSVPQESSPLQSCFRFSVRELRTYLQSQVMRMPLPSDLSAEDLEASASGKREGLVEEFVTLPEGQNIGYLELDLRPDYRYLYWTVPGEESEPDGQVRQM